METADARGSRGKLAAGVRVSLFAAKWDRPCARCAEWVYGEDGVIRRDTSGRPIPRGNAPTPCQSCAKVPTWAKTDGTKTYLDLRKLAADMSPENLKAYDRYREWRATGRFPDDPIVQWYSGIIGPIYEEWNHAPLERSAAAVTTLVTYLTIRMGGRR